jgi:hypothetical protein
MSHTLEQWRPIAGLEGRYEVSNLGRVKSLARTETHLKQGKPVTYRRRERILKPGVAGNGYLTVSIGLFKNQKSVTVHFLVASAFLPPCPGLYGLGDWVIDHINADRKDNRVNNLRWVTQQQNNSTETFRARCRLQALQQPRAGSRFISRADAHKPASIAPLDEPAG